MLTLLAIYLLTNNTVLQLNDWKVNLNISAGGIKAKDGTILIDKESILERWAEFYEDLYKDDPSTYLEPDYSEEEAIPPILRSEVENAIKEMKIGIILVHTVQEELLLDKRQ